MKRRKGTRRTIVIPDDWWERIMELSAAGGQTAGDFIRDAIYRRIADPRRPLSEPFPRGRPRG